MFTSNLNPPGSLREMMVSIGEVIFSSSESMREGRLVSIDAAMWAKSLKYLRRLVRVSSSNILTLNLEEIRRAQGGQLKCPIVTTSSDIQNGGAFPTLQLAGLVPKAPRGHLAPKVRSPHPATTTRQHRRNPPPLVAFANSRLKWLKNPPFAECLVSLTSLFKRGVATEGIDDSFV